MFYIRNIEVYKVMHADNLQFCLYIHVHVFAIGGYLVIRGFLLVFCLISP